ncbi:MAG: 50S ribosomal protein L10 [Thermoplasmatota archaeon]
MTEISAWKKEEVEKLKNLLETSPVLGIVDIEGIPAFQMQQMRAKLRGTANLVVSRNTLINKAINQSDRDGIEELEEFISGQTALVSTDLNPFKLFNRMEKTKTKAPASGGESAPEDIIVERGDTPFKPGPIVGDLQKAGIPASIQGGKVVINKDKVVAEEGEIISKDLATMLGRLNIHPITVGLDLRIVFEDGTTFDRETLDIDPEEFIDDITTGASSAYSLSVNISYPTKENIKTLISKVHNDALSLAVNTEIITDETVEIKLTEAQKNMLSLAAELDPSSLDDELLEKLGIEIEDESSEEDESEEDEEVSEDDDSEDE